MKSPQSEEDIEPTSHLDEESLAKIEGSAPIEELVEDLTQQDVLPSELGTVAAPDDLLSGGLDETGRWDEPIASHGVRADRIPLEDEDNLYVALVTEGVEEADEELRELDEAFEDELEKEEELEG